MFGYDDGMKSLIGNCVVRKSNIQTMLVLSLNVVSDSI